MLFGHGDPLHPARFQGRPSGSPRGHLEILGLDPFADVEEVLRGENPLADDAELILVQFPARGRVDPLEHRVARPRGQGAEHAEPGAGNDLPVNLPDRAVGPERLQIEPFVFRVEHRGGLDPL